MFSCGDHEEWTTAVSDKGGEEKGRGGSEERKKRNTRGILITLYGGGRCFVLMWRS